MKLPRLWAAAALTAALSPSIASAQTYELRQTARGLVVSATGVATLSSPNLSFTAAAGAWAEARSVLVTNTREGPLGISSWEVRQGYGYNGFYVSGSTCPEELEPGASCEVSVRPQV